MTRWAGGLIAAVILAVIWATNAAAHTRSQSHSLWEVNGSSVRLTYSIPLIEVARLSEAGAPVSDLALAAYVSRRVGVSAGDRACAVAGRVRSLSATPVFRRLEILFTCPDGHDLKLKSKAFLDIAPSHTNFAQIQAANGEFVEQLFNSDQQVLDLSAKASNPLQNASFLEYVRMGIMHIFTGPDHMSFLLGLVLISRRLKDLVFVITGFTIGHSLTLALAVTGILRPHAEYIDALVALTIALIGAENLAIQSGKPLIVAAGLGGLLGLMALARVLGFGLLPPLLLLGAGIFTANYLMISGRLRDAGRVRLVVTLVFGLVHGFGFAADLLEMKLPVTRLAELLVGFNLGVEIGQLTLVLGVTAAVLVLSRLKLTLPRPLVVDVAGSALVAIGTYWFVSRSFA